MDTLFPSVLCLLLGVALPVTIGVILGRRVHQQTAAPAAYRAVARNLGLDVDTRGASVNGYLPTSGQKLYIGEVVVGHGPESSTEHRAVLALSRPLGLGLAVRKQTGHPWLRRARGHHISIGEEAFDKKFHVTGDDDERVRELLTPEIRERLQTLGAAHPNLLISDHHVRVLLAKPITEAEALAGFIDTLVQLTDALSIARQRIPPPKRLDAQLMLFADLATERGLTFEPAWPALSGAINGHTIEVVVGRDEEGYRATVTGRLRNPRKMGFRLRRQIEPDGYWSTGQDIQVNDSTFDDAFVIKGYSPDTVRRWLTPRARQRLLSLSDLGELVADDHIVRVAHLALDASSLRDAIDRVLASLSALEDPQAQAT
jgi:hypothetical protein